MVLVLFFVVLLIVAVIYNYVDREDYMCDWIFTWASSVLLGIVLFCIIISHVSFEVELTKFESRRNTIEYQRGLATTEYERAALTKSIVDDNMWLVGVQKNKQMIWINWYIPKKVMDVEPIR